LLISFASSVNKITLTWISKSTISKFTFTVTNRRIAMNQNRSRQINHVYISCIQNREQLMVTGDKIWIIFKSVHFVTDRVLPFIFSRVYAFKTKTTYELNGKSICFKTKRIFQLIELNKIDIPCNHRYCTQGKQNQN